jgi:hypothetical protein
VIRELRQFIREPSLARIGGFIRASQDAPACDGGPHRQTAEMFLVALGVAVLLAVAGAFGTNSWPFGMRLLYWLLSTCVGYGVAIVSYDLIHHLMRIFRRPLVATGVYVIVGTPLIASFVWLVAPVLFHSDLTLFSFLSVLWPILAINIALLALKFLLAHRLVPVVAVAETPVPSARTTPFHDRLPLAFRSAQVRAVLAEDHYLRVYTDRGEVLILMRLRDAVRELEGIDGAQTHRSWWVAKDAVERTIKGNKRFDLMLKGNVVAPVSRSYQKMLRTNGWV